MLLWFNYWAACWTPPFPGTPGKRAGARAARPRCPHRQYAHAPCKTTLSKRVNRWGRCTDDTTQASAYERKIPSYTAASVEASRLEVGSSRNRMEASRAAIRPRARAMRCFCPPEKLAPRSAISVSNPSGSSSTRGPSRAASMARSKPPADSPIPWSNSGAGWPRKPRPPGESTWQLPPDRADGSGSRHRWSG